MKSDGPTPVAIVGGGFSGTAMLAELTRRGVPAVLIEGDGKAGLGAAYSTREPEHLLNVRAEVMSARVDDPDHFVRFVEGEGGHRHDFAERRQFGRYMTGQLEQALAAGGGLIGEKAVGAERSGPGWRVALADGGQIEAAALVLALGNQAPEPPSAFADAGPKFVNNPWGSAARAAERQAAGTGADVLLLGTGLTMVDTALSLDAAGHRGRILAVSRRGLLPRAHVEQPGPPAPVEAADLPAGNVRSMWRWLRRRAGEVDWRKAVDSLRPHAHFLWQAFDHDQKRRFLRHARPWWDVHRHRIAPQVARQIRDLIADGRLEVAAGRVRGAAEVPGGIEVDIQRRGRAQAERSTFGFVFNCTGPLGAIGRTRDVMLRHLFDSGLVKPDPLGLAIDVDQRSRPTGAGAERLWALGPMTKGRYWEIIAVPDIRVQVAAVADDIARELAA